MERENQPLLAHTPLAGKIIPTRGAPRVTKRVKLTCHTQQQFQAMMNNISLGGLALETEKPLRRDTEITTEISIASGQSPVEVTGKVVRATKVNPKSYIIGVRFLPLSPEKKRALAEMLASLATRR